MSRLRMVILSVLVVGALAAVASASASAINLEWQTCQKTTGGKENAGCTATGTVSEWITLSSSTEKKKVTSSGGTFILTEGSLKITCAAVSGKGTITGGKPGTDLAETITYTGCETTEGAACTVHSPSKAAGTIEPTNISTELIEAEPKGGGAKKEADNFKGGAVGFVKLEFSGTGCATPGYVNTEVEGNVAAETKVNELVFPAAELKGDTLKAFGKAASLSGSVKQKLENATEGENVQAF